MASTMASNSPVDIARTAALASRTLKAVSGGDRNAALTAVHAALEKSKDVILEANQKDMEAAQKLVDAGKMRQSLAKRLFLNQSKWEGMLKGILDVRELEDPGMIYPYLLCDLRLTTSSRKDHAGD